VSRRFDKNAGRIPSPPAGASHSRHDGYCSPQNDSLASDTITSKNNRWLKLFRAGLQGGGPSAGEAIAVEGPKLIEDAFRAGLRAEALLVSESGDKLLERILRAARDTDDGISQSRVLKTSDQLFANASGTDTPQGVAALFQQPNWHFENVLGPRKHRASSPAASSASAAAVALVVVVLGVQDPGNVGTILRSAEAFGATGVVAARGTADPWSPKAVRASAGSALRIPVLRAIAANSLLTQLRAAGLKILATSSHSAVATDGISPDLSSPTAIWIGSEGDGLPDGIIQAADATIAIPIDAAVESLNAGVAASIVLYEAARQRARSHPASKL
jgi:TrmH family RNA methyltransferase